MQTFDSIIIGSGQAGTPLAFKLSSEGHSVAFIEKERFGGTCLNTGCTPTKAYVASAKRIFDAKNSQHLGIIVPDGVVADLEKIKARKDELIKGSVEGIENALKKNDKITVFEGEATFTGQKELLMNDVKIKAENIFINVGGRPKVPGGFKDVNYLTNKSILELKEIPDHLIIAGGSYIGLEFGQIFRRFGSKVTIIEKNERIIAHEDEEVSVAVQKILENEGVEFRLNATCLEGKELADGSIQVSVDCNDGDPDITGTHLLLAVGRDANNDTLNLHKTGLETNEKGYLEVNDHLETKVKGIYALGDCNGHGAFTHTSYNDYEILIDNLFGSKTKKLSDRILTYVLFTDPPLARAGMTVEQAKATGRSLKIGHRPMNRVARAREKGETDGFMSVVVDAQTDKILGSAILGTTGDEVVSTILTCMYADAPYTALQDAVIPHPTVAELVPTMLESMETMG